MLYFLCVCRLGLFPQQKSRISKVSAFVLVVTLLHAGQASGSKACTSYHSFCSTFPLHAWVTQVVASHSSCGSHVFRASHDLILSTLSLQFEHPESSGPEESTLHTCDVDCPLVRRWSRLAGACHQARSQQTPCGVGDGVLPRALHLSKFVLKDTSIPQQASSHARGPAQPDDALKAGPCALSPVAWRQGQGGGGVSPAVRLSGRRRGGLGGVAAAAGEVAVGAHHDVGGVALPAHAQVLQRRAQREGLKVASSAVLVTAGLARDGDSTQGLPYACLPG